MKIALNWLKDHINFTETPEEICAKLTSSGLEVEGLENFELVKGGLAGVIVGEVESCDRHPDADKLSITSVNVGSEENLPIVCGAPNVAKGQKVLVATVGSTLYPSPEESFKIKKAKIRGVVSLGMICAEDELGLGTSHDGIMVLDPTTKVGAPASEVLNLKSEQVIEIGLTPNRADAMSHFGVARDVQALTGNTIKEIEGADLKGECPVKITVNNTTACPRYAGVKINNIQVKESPEWLKNRLKSIGINPKNNIVDITNYILHDLGQPLHAFDIESVGNEIIVSNAQEGSDFTTLDEVKRKLKPEDLVICNGSNQPMCLAGVMGGLTSGVSEKTTSIFLESAYFDATVVRKTSLVHTLKSDSSFRFERGTDPNMVVTALQKAISLITELAGGEVEGGITDVYPTPVSDSTFDVYISRIQALIGVEIPETRITSILESLDITILAREADKWSLQVPAYRVDVQREADIAEEVLRIFGFENVPIDKNLSSKFLAQNNSKSEDLVDSVSNYLVSNGFNESITNSLTKPSYAELIEEINLENNVVILNKLSEDHEVMRQSLLFSGLEVIRHNINRKSENVKIFEFGKTYHLVEGEYVEKKVLSLWITGNKNQESWDEKSEKVTYFDLSATVLSVLERLGLNFKNQERISSSVYSAGMSLNVFQGQLVSLGALQGKLVDSMSINQAVYYAEFDVDLILSLISKKLVVKELSKYPEVRRDLSVVLDKDTSFDQVLKITKKTEKKLITGVNVFDVYEGENLEKGKKSYSVSFTLQDQQNTLKDTVIDKIMTKLILAFEKELGAIIRR